MRILCRVPAQGMIARPFLAWQRVPEFGRLFESVQSGMRRPSSGQRGHGRGSVIRSVKNRAPHRRGLLRDRGRGPVGRRLAGARADLCRRSCRAPIISLRITSSRPVGALPPPSAATLSRSKPAKSLCSPTASRTSCRAARTCRPTRRCPTCSKPPPPAASRSASTSRPVRLRSGLSPDIPPATRGPIILS